MRFLLVAVNAKYIHSNPAIYSLRAYAGEALQKYIELAEYTINQSVQDILADIYSRKPDIVGLSCYIWNWRMIQELLMELPKLLPDTVIWLGGPEVSYDGEQVLKCYPQVAGIMVGEGEATFRELLAYYMALEAEGAFREEVQSTGKTAWEKGLPSTAVSGERRTERGEKSLQDIAGLYLSSGYTPFRDPVDMSTIPFLYQDLAPFENRIIYYESGRGCPYSCSYCLSSIDKKLRFRHMDMVKKELQFFLDHRVAQVKFVDRTFNCNHEHAMEIWRYITEHDNGVTNFHFEISADILREEEIALLNQMRPGLVQLEIGVQTTNEETLSAIRRRMDVEKLERIVVAIHNGKNVHIHLDLIAGLPYEDYESFKESFNRVYAMEPQQLQLGFLKVLKGSYMHEKAKDYGLVYREQPPYEVLYTKWLTYDEVCRLKRIEEVVELYYNSNQYTHTLPVLLQAFDSPFDMFERMADYFEQQGYFLNSPARAYRYQVLLDFASCYDAEHLALYRELLTFDMYLRENLKSRPAFAADMAPHKAYVQTFYKKEAETRSLLPAYERYDWKQLSKMTHMEYFSYPVWDVTDILGERIPKEAECAPLSRGAYVLFDYRNRNPLTYEAAYTVIDGDMIHGGNREQCDL